MLDTIRSTGRRQAFSFLLLLGLAAMLGGCASYHPSPLPSEPALKQEVGRLKSPATGRLSPPERYAFNPSDGLDLTELAILAVLNNPELQAERAGLRVAGAQLFSAGLLPDPQISANLDHPTDAGAGLMNAWGAGFAYDIIPLVTRQARIDTRRQEKKQVDLQILWHEWQVVQRVRSLAVRFRLEQEKLDLLHRTVKLYRQRYQHSAAALARGDLTLDVNGTDLTALVDALSQVNQLAQTHNETGHDLNLLLGLAPGARLDLRLPAVPEAMDAAALRSALSKIQKRRPDLLALKAGYESQEARVRAAVLAQFPSFSVGVNRARDTGGIYTSGFSIALNLPFFSGNRGEIAVERATREQLRVEYQARLDRAVMEVDKLIELQGIVDRQQGKLRQYLPKLEKMVQRGRQAYQQGDINALTFINMETTLVNKRLEQLSLEQTQWENRIALECLLALPEGRAPLPATGQGGE